MTHYFLSDVCDFIRQDFIEAGRDFSNNFELRRFIWRVDERVGKEIKESKAQRSLALFLIRRLAFKESLLPSLTVKVLLPLPLVLSGHFLNYSSIFYIVRTRFQSTYQYSRKISPSYLIIYRISLDLISSTFQIFLWQSCIIEGDALTCREEKFTYCSYF